MNKLKVYVIQIIVVAAIVQLGGLIINGKAYQKLYRLVGAIFLMTTLFTFPAINLEDLVMKPIDTSINYDADSDYIATEFTKRVAVKIKDGIKNQYGIDCDVDVSTDYNYTNLSIRVSHGADKAYDELISEYVAHNFCTQNDEVIVGGKET